MDRRDFLHGLTLASAATATPLAAFAGTTGGCGETAAVVLLTQPDTAGAATLSAAIASSLARAGVGAVRTETFAGADLAALPALATTLCQVPGRQIVGVMDDAAAVVFLAVAGSHGAGYRLQAHHRVGAAGARHDVRPTGLDDALAWSERPEAWERQIATLYADIVAGHPPRALRLERMPGPRAQAGAASLVSFVVNT